LSPQGDPNTVNRNMAYSIDVTRRAARVGVLPSKQLKSCYSPLR